jgi:hypothetical protein
MVLFKDNLNQWVPVRRNGTVNQNRMSFWITVKQLFDMCSIALPQEFVAQATRILITKFMPLSTSDLESWANDPEEWFNAEEVENDHQWEFELRVCLVCYHCANHFLKVCVAL